MPGRHFPKGEDVTGWFKLYFAIHVLSSYHIVHGIPSFSFHYLITHAAPHFIYTRNLTCFEFPALPGWACALQFIKTAIRFTPMLVYLLTFFCRCTLPGHVIFFIAHSLFNCHSSFCYHVIHCFVIYTQMHFSSLKQLTVYTYACIFIDILLSLYSSRPEIRTTTLLS